jgi:hypothetical protein
LEYTLTRLQCDNQSIVKLVQNPVLHAHMRHIEMHHHYICEQIHSGQLDLMYVATTKQETYILIKPLSSNKFHAFKTYIGVLDRVDLYK